MDRRCEPAEGIDFAVEHGDAEVVARLRQRRTRAPAIRDRVVFLVARHCFARYATAESEEFVSNRRRGHLPAHCRHRRILRPRSGRRLRLRWSERGDHQTTSEQQRNDGDAPHANLPLWLGLWPAQRRTRRIAYPSHALSRAG
jgi:hypothetical protein